MPSRNRGKPKLKLRDLDRIPISPADRIALINAIQVEAHPITAAVLGAVMVEHELELLLRRRFFRKDDETWWSLVSENGPLSSFYGKILMGYAFGIYDEKIRDDLNVIRHVRNAFAHAKRLIDFDNELVVAELQRLKGRYIPKRYFTLAPEVVGVAIKAGYITMCYRISSKLTRKRTRHMRVADHRAIQRLSKRAPKFQGILGHLPSPAIGTRGSHPLPTLVRQSADPSLGALERLLFGPPPAVAKSGRSTGK